MKIRQEKAITLVALIITIIVLLILAMVGIRLVMNGGIISRTENGTKLYSDAEIEEKIKLAYSELQMAKYTNSNLNEVDFLTQSLENQGLSDVQVSGNSASGFTITIGERIFKISSEGNVTEHKPFNTEEWDKTAADEDCFIWESDDVNSEDYGMVIGYTSKINNYTKLRYPTRVTKIKFNNFYDNATTRSYTNNIKKVELPDTVIEIYGSAFGTQESTSFKNLEEIVLSNSITKINYDTFFGCTNLKNVVIPDGVTQIFSNAFKNCTSLSDITIPDSVTDIGSDAFVNTSWYNNQPDGIVYAGKNVYKYKGIMPENTNITIRNGTKSITLSAFSGCTNLVNVILPEGIIRISGNAFSGCTNLNNITIPNSVTYVGSSAFDNTGWYNNQPNGIIYINNVLYKYKNDNVEQEEIKIANGTTTISPNAFQGVKNIKNIIIPISVTQIGNFAFSGWTSEQTIKCEAAEKLSGWDIYWHSASWDSTQANVIWNYSE